MEQISRVFSLKSFLLWMIEKLLMHKKPRVPVPCTVTNKMWVRTQVVSVHPTKVHVGLEIQFHTFFYLVYWTEISEQLHSPTAFIHTKRGTFIHLMTVWESIRKCLVGLQQRRIFYPLRETKVFWVYHPVAQSLNRLNYPGKPLLNIS